MPDEKVPMQVRVTLTETKVRDDDGPFKWEVELMPTQVGRFERFDHGESENWDAAIAEVGEVLETMWEE